MQNKIYLDVFFMINVIMDYLILHITLMLAGIQCSFVRKIMASFLGGTWAVIAIILMTKHENCKYLIGIVTYLVISALMLLVVFGWNGRNLLVKGFVFLYAAAFCLSGACYGIWYYMVPGYAITTGLIKKEAIILGIVFLFVIKVFMEALIRVRERYGNEICKVKLLMNHHWIQFQGLIDTGNVLTDPYTGKMVHIVRSSVMKKILEDNEDYAALHYRLVPFRSVGNEHGMIPVIDVECMEVYERNKMIYKDNAAIGIYDGSLSDAASYDAILNASVFRK